MFANLQFIAVTAFLLWGLASALCDVLPDDGARRERKCAEGRQSSGLNGPQRNIGDSS
ncbi:MULTISPECIES: hypothetical protein [Mycolicibacterium]|jgi:hypothetical protein|uniref:hypothetical protein n=1 Tax=Mycolicibacterium TaxID=1866885 RepID=UPI00031E712C|nr:MULTISPECIES: hypothetical protein [Mycolicibacterium]MCV7128287.1 hypothetical protein [Mycolicibacterium vanbaalenii PYR-1]MDW5611255.1 hypothetical protein [Mycolicibacterium sp. D5.8-2]QZY44615.1 hypothetical protein K5L12_20470 [Mycolicibacterium austroafricanum]UJL28252.1 hypothetical protein HZU38_25955 [Mycolicibacterium vanbaalenii]WND54945.1 hypothetical protein QQA43_19540 [Mycolicibacterium vanbaalenii]